MERASDQRHRLGAEPSTHQLRHQPTLAAPRPGRSERPRFPGSKAVVFDFLNNQLPEPLNSLLLLSLRVLPVLAEVIPPPCVGDVLIVTPEGVEPSAQFVDEIPIVIRASTRLAEMAVLRFCCDGHGHSLGDGRRSGRMGNCFLKRAGGQEHAGLPVLTRGMGAPRQNNRFARTAQRTRRPEASTDVGTPVRRPRGVVASPWNEFILRGGGRPGRDRLP